MSAARRYQEQGEEFEIILRRKGHAFAWDGERFVGPIVDLRVPLNVKPLVIR